jgi:hypothetical protein
VSFVGAGTPSASFTSWAAPVTDTEVAAFGAFLTVFELYFADPSSQILGDLEFADTLSDDVTGTEYRVSVPVEFVGIPLGWIIVALALAGGFGAFVVVSSVGAKRS